MCKAAKGITWSSSEKPESCTLLRAKKARARARAKSQEPEIKAKVRARKSRASRARERWCSNPTEFYENQWS